MAHKKNKNKKKLRNKTPKSLMRSMREDIKRNEADMVVKSFRNPVFAAEFGIDIKKIEEGETKPEGFKDLDLS